jgi:large subunit ribosomal protein L20
MVRVKRGNVARKRRKKILHLAKGYKGAHSRLFRVANQQVMKALRYSYTDRRKKQRVFRSLWISRINAFLKHEIPYMYGTKRISYSRLMYLLKCREIRLNRKMLAQIIALDSTTYEPILRAVGELK